MENFTIPWSDPISITDSEIIYRSQSFSKTVGTVFLFGGEGQPPFPTTDQLIQAFDSLHCPGKSKLTVGARALSKHCERSGPRKEDAQKQQQKNYQYRGHPYWTRPVGSELVKNQMARKQLDDLLAQPVLWKNIHQLNQETIVYEIRDGKSLYGMRWTIHPDFSVSFRGYLEPQSVQGLGQQSGEESIEKLESESIES
jgi:hypothetical protein